jgi:hypothetical protein
MNFLTPTELRRTLKISRSTEHRLLKSGMPCISSGRLRRYDPETAVAWFSQYAHQNTSKKMLAPGDYQCPRCGTQGIIQEPCVPGPCRHCGSRATPVRIIAYH